MRGKPRGHDFHDMITVKSLRFRLLIFPVPRSAAMIAPVLVPKMRLNFSQRQQPDQRLNFLEGTERVEAFRPAAVEA